MTKEKDKKAKEAGKTAGSRTSRSTASAQKKQSTAQKKTKQTKTVKTTKTTAASTGWKDKKAQIRERSKGPKTLAEQKANQGKGPIRRFLANKSGLIDMFAVPLFAFAVLCLYSMASKNEREAAVWCTNFSKQLFGNISYLIYFWIAAFCARLWLRNFQKFKEIHYRRWLYCLGLFSFLALVLQYNANKHIPVLPASENGGGIADLIVRMITNVLGNGGMVILLVALTLYFIWQAWKFLAARERELNGKDQDVPVRVYWENIRTAAEAEEMEAEQRKSGPLTSDIESDFRSTVGLLSAREAEEKHSGKDIRQEAGTGLRKLRETLKEISQPAVDKDAMIPKEPAKRKTQPLPQTEKAALKKGSEKPSRKDRKPQQEQLPLTPAPAEEKPEEKPAEPVFEENEDPNGSGLLSAPAPAPKKEPEPEVRVRTRKVNLDENSEKVTMTQHDYTFVPNVPSEKEISAASTEKASDPWILPNTAEILDPVKQHKGVSPDDPEITAQAKKIEERMNFLGVPGTVVDIQCGPTFSQFGVEPGFIERGGRKTRVRVKQIEGIQKDLEMILSAKQLTIEAPIPGKTYVGIQIQNKNRTPVSLREVIENSDFQNRHYELGIALGKDINGAVFGADLTRMPHLLIAGATGSGKSVCLNAILACLLLHNSPEKLKLVLVDPKRVELTGYNGIPHLITPVVTETDQVGNILQWVLREMDMRNLHFMENGVRNIQDYNLKFPGKTLPYIVIVIDELANLMMEAGPDIEASIVRLAQTARAMGIHLIVATQRPSKDVITGTIKGNLPTRIAFAVATNIDSQVILDRGGAERLFGKGDMYFLSTEATALKRLQCVYVSDEEIRRIVDYWKKKPRIDSPESQDPDLVPVPQPVTEKVLRPQDFSGGTLTQLPLFNEPAPPLKKEGDDLYEQAIRLVQRSGRASSNMLVSRMGIGFTRANKLLTWMERDGIIGPQDPNNHSLPREILDYGPYGPENDGEKD